MPRPCGPYWKTPVIHLAWWFEAFLRNMFVCSGMH